MDLQSRHSINIYAATKASEIMAHSYSHYGEYRQPHIRFFTCMSLGDQIRPYLNLYQILDKPILQPSEISKFTMLDLVSTIYLLIDRF